MTGFVLYSTQWKKKHKESFTILSQEAARLSIPLYQHAERIKSREDVKWLLKGTDNGFEDIVKKNPPRSFFSKPYSEAIDWLLDKPNFTFTSLLAVYLNDNGTIFRIDRDLKGVKYFLHCVDSMRNKKEESF